MRTRPGQSHAAFVPVAVACCTLLKLLDSSPASRAAEPQAPVSVRIVPERVTLHGARAGQRFLVLGTFADGLERDVTGRSRFSLSPPRLAALDPAGRLTARADG